LNAPKQTLLRLPSFRRVWRFLAVHEITEFVVNRLIRITVLLSPKTQIIIEEISLLALTDVRKGDPVLFVCPESASSTTHIPPLLAAQKRGLCSVEPASGTHVSAEKGTAPWEEPHLLPPSVAEFLITIEVSENRHGSRMGVCH
jgi:hypothetical protein